MHSGNETKRGSMPKPSITGYIAALLLSASLAGGLNAQEAKTYIDGQGRQIFFPLGELSFADQVIDVKVGKPAPKSEAARRQENILGEPVNSSLSLGCSGVAVVRFVNNTLVDIEGPDLYIFEIGKEVEATQLAISTNGRDWIDIGPISGSTAAIDIAKFTDDPSAIYQYVRLTDRNIKCKAGKYSGADIDAVGAIGAAVRVTLDGNVLFDFDSADLREEARAELGKVTKTLNRYPGAQVIVEGHTDSKGSDAYNLELSQQRAASVRDFLVSSGATETSKSETRGFGETRPVATNETDEGRQKNRRVDLIIIPKRS
ncbi:MAG: OmpA family protein [Pseudomonadota bacterium]